MLFGLEDIDFPAGGEVEYKVDADDVDDNWIPRVWQVKFGR
jgi:hypothetical protein